MVESKFVKCLMSIISISSDFSSFFIAITHYFSVNFELMHFLLPIIGSHQSPNFDTFKCSDENLLNSSCHFPNRKSVFLQILHDSSVSWKITPLYVFRSKVTYFVQKGNSSNSTSLFSIMKHNSSVLFQLKFYILSTKGAYQSKNFLKFHLSGWKSKILHFDGPLL